MDKRITAEQSTKEMQRDREKSGVILADEYRENAIYQVKDGCSHPLGAKPDAEGVNFAVFADRATSVELLLFDECDDLDPIFTVRLNPLKHKTFHTWHVYIKGARPGIHYAYRVDGPHDLSGKGDRYNFNKVLIDPYARGNTDKLWNRKDACTDEDNIRTSMRSVVIDIDEYDWEGDQPLQRPINECIIYEMHVRGFTKSSTSGCQNAGTFAGIIEKIPYLQELGINTVELLPVFDFDQTEIRHLGPDGQGLTNYWGYDPISFFAPPGSYCQSPESGNHVTEFRDMVKAFHKAGIEIILDVVFNHTNEGNEQGPVINLKGFANACCYLLSSADKQYYMNYSGCGNTINGNHPIMGKLIVDSLNYWVTEMHVDGFRFDEAAILCRDENGQPMLYPPVIWQIELSEVMVETKLIAEAWDAAGLYTVGVFPGYRWGEWNGRYRDVIRHFVRGDKGYDEGKSLVGRVADVVAGSADIFERDGKLPLNSINFITSHDGFTLNDLVSYDHKHNEANGENNTDGIDENLSWNCGWEGATDDVAIEELRLRQIKSFFAILMLSQGIPMFVAGDEVRRTQQGNNNAYCQDNEISWFDWSLVEKNSGLFRFFQHMIMFRKRYSCLRRNWFYSGQHNSRGIVDIAWHGCFLSQPGWDNPDSRVLAYTIGSIEEGGEIDHDIHIMMNMEWEDLDFELPPSDTRQWYRIIDTGQPHPNDFVKHANAITETVYRVKKHSVVVCVNGLFK